MSLLWSATIEELVGWYGAYGGGGLNAELCVNTHGDEVKVFILSMNIVCTL